MIQKQITVAGMKQRIRNDYSGVHENRRSDPAPDQGSEGRIRTEYHRTHHTGRISEAEDPVAAGAVQSAAAEAVWNFQRKRSGISQRYLYVTPSENRSNTMIIIIQLI